MNEADTCRKYVCPFDGPCRDHVTAPGYALAHESESHGTPP